MKYLLSHNTGFESQSFLADKRGLKNEEPIHMFQKNFGDLVEVGEVMR